MRSPSCRRDKILPGESYDDTCGPREVDLEAMKATL